MRRRLTVTSTRPWLKVSEIESLTGGTDAATLANGGVGREGRRMRSLRCWFVALASALANAAGVCLPLAWWPQPRISIRHLLAIRRRQHALENHRRRRDPRAYRRDAVASRPTCTGGLTSSLPQRYLREQGLAVTWDKTRTSNCFGMESQSRPPPSTQVCNMKFERGYGTTQPTRPQWTTRRVLLQQLRYRSRTHSHRVRHDHPARWSPGTSGHGSLHVDDSTTPGHYCVKVQLNPA